MTSVADLYGDGRGRMLALAESIDDGAAATPVPACPGWSVKDVYAHLAGVCADALAGKLQGLPTDEQTAQQVAERRDLTLVEVCAEWQGSGAQFEDVLRSFGDQAPPQPVFDVWNHEHDVRGALGRPGNRDLPVVAWMVDRILGMFGGSWAKRALPTVRVTTGSGSWMLGDGEAVASLTTSDFDLARTVIGHRSRAQAVALGWEPAAPDVVIDALHGFQYAAQDIVE